MKYPRTIEKDGYFCLRAEYDPFPYWPVEKIYRDNVWVLDGL